MKKSLLAMFMAGCLLASCNNDEPNPNAGTGELETSYIAVSVNSANASTRAEDGVYDDGEENEQKVTTAHFFFFKASGEPFTLNQDSFVGGSGKANYVVKDISNSGNNNMPNVETITNVVLTIQNLEGEHPAQMLVVLNWDYAGDKISLTDLRNTLADYAAAVENTNKGFLMSNSAYVKEETNTVITATPITIDNIASSASAAMDAPVQVFVERVAAKVTLKKNESVSANFDTGVTGPDGKKIYARIVGWDVNTTLDRSYLVKEIDATWQNTTLGFTWNDEPYYRSYWANSVAADDANVKYDTKFSYAGLTNQVNAIDYCLENTARDTHTKVVIAAKLEDESQNPVQVARLYSEMYTFEGIKNVIANALKDHYYYGDETKKETILPEHIDFYVADTSGKDSYTVKYRLTDAAAQLNWYYTVDAGKTFTAKTADEVNLYLASLEGAQAWNGMAYYTVDIEHLGKNKGVVRNHSYVITVDGIKGLGTPVYDPNTEVTEPVKPVEATSYVSARINVLSWRIVNQNVVLQ